MTEQQPPSNGRDFVIGFFSSTIPATLLIVASGFGVTGKLAALFPIAIIVCLVAVIVATIMAFKHKRKYIAIGLLASILAVPLLVFGSCLAIISNLSF